MKIVFVSEYFPQSENCEVRGGVEARCFFVAKELAKKHDVTVVASWEQGSEKKHQICGINVIRCGIERKYSQGGSIFARISFIWAAYRTIKNLDYDVIDSQIYIPHLAAAFLPGKKFMTYHSVWIGKWAKYIGLHGLILELIEKWLLSLDWERVIAVSESTKKELTEAGVKPKKIHVVKNGVVDCNVEVKKSKFPTLSCVSRLVKYKNIDDLLQAVHIIKNTYPKVQCNIVGTGPEKERLINLCKILGIDKNVKFLGFKKHHIDVIKTISRSHVFCLPSSFEGFGIALQEANACRVPYVCSDIPSLVETTECGKGGLLFKKKDYQDMAEKIKRLLDDKQFYAQKTKEQIKKYKWEDVANSLKEIYR